MEAEEARPAPSSSLGRNAAAVFLANAWTSLLGLALVPVYVRFVGVEAYGLVGVFAVVQSVVSLLDAGLSTTLNRELARLSGQGAGADERRDLVRTLEVVYWVVAAAIAVVLLPLTWALAHRWVHPEQLSDGQVREAMLLMAAAFVLQWPSALYSGGLYGLERHARQGAAMAAVATVRGVGAVAVLAWISPTLRAFFAWQVLSSALQTALLAALLWRALPAGAAARFRMARLRGVGRFAAAVSGTSVLVLLLTQLDKVVLSRMVSLTEFGYYTLAGVVGMGLSRLVTPLHAAYFPRFAGLMGRAEGVELGEAYHRGCQVMAVAVLPAAAVLVLFSPEVLRLWTGDPQIVRNAWLLVSLVVAGTALNALMVLPYALQVAAGWVRLGLLANLAALAVLGPTLVLAVGRWGAPGAAAAWVLLNVGYLLFTPALMHRRLLPGHLGRWYARDVALPLAAAAGTAGLGRLVTPAGLSAAEALAAVAAVSCCTLAATLLAAPAVRGPVLRRMRTLSLRPAAAR